MLTVDDFVPVTKHPFGMLEGYQNASEKESTLAFILSKVLEAGDLNAVVKTNSNHPDMVGCGLLIEVREGEYRLSKKAVGLLYSVWKGDKLMEQQGWEEQKGSYYKWDDENLNASLIHHIPEHDGHPYERYSVQIHTSDGGLVVIGYIRIEHFDADVAQSLADLALSENQTYDWWIANATEWWMQHNIDSLSL